ncbi:MAG: tRNA (N6-threonylcarbamoyladenosine(37)-N6)-methyltransferase TrmO [Thiohalocapsa sp.]|jgi:tRNA-Thr(GGU) m(6)t(6)A37 methyltransferase TsaA|uniref:tRNA (N6-threonylcarbamoyladenosine(37)-N6)-methyltransferase TrmO n=1 Tax=Thiohalocapsa sp. TaxID=2497641 RepID=UPI0025D4777C|nr:tRNA (N6-threonylcarbamoyladenosine(37)-N6)-methyltransferase TrmO [Thiohalocapsa sp.]MCG6940324.1 tRNA (N6-threonylcarbamoyladenosine(37)-N6)-methyltransferase TrmO [Thiohalocapsa sp.]
MTGFAFEAIGTARTPFTDKFGIPRQPRLVDAPGRILLHPPYDRIEAFSGLEGFSHVWLLWVFHDDCLTAGWKPRVRPPRLGGRRSVGVFASRAPYRPNPIGLSAVAHHGLVEDADGLALAVSGVDLLDGTPVLDIKPYVPYADALPEAAGGFARPEPATRLVARFSEAAAAAVAARDPDGALALARLIEQVIAEDPRPGYMDRYPERREFALRLYDCDIRWQLDGDTAIVEQCIPQRDTPP